MIARKRALGVVFCILLISPWVLGSTIQAKAETVKFKLYNYRVKAVIDQIGDVEDHVLGQNMRRGFFVTDNGEVATYLGIYQNDIIKTSGSFKGYVTITFSDGSKIIWKAEGTMGGTSATALQTAGGKSEIIKGTGRFEGIKGTVTTTTKYLPLEKGEEGQKQIIEGTLTYTLPSK